MDCDEIITKTKVNRNNYIGVGTRGARAPPQVFSLFHICSVLQSNLLHTVPSQSKSLSCASELLHSRLEVKVKL